MIRHAPFRVGFLAFIVGAGLLPCITFAAPELSLRPVPRQDGIKLSPPASSAAPARTGTDAKDAADKNGVTVSLRPVLRSRRLEQAAKTQRSLRAKGAVCGDLALQGAAIGRVAPKLKGCGVNDAVQLQSVSGVRLSQAAVMDCVTAKALKTWVDNVAKPAFAKRGELRSLRVAAHYSCRTRNNLPGAKISEHGRGRAIDISGFQLKNGAEISVLTGWDAAATRKALRQIHKGACGPFGTVLGPNSDRFHRDHFHFDTARQRSGPYCR